VCLHVPLCAVPMLRSGSNYGGRGEGRERMGAKPVQILSISTVLLLQLSILLSTGTIVLLL